MTNAVTGPKNTLLKLQLHNSVSVLLYTNAHL